MDEMAIKGQQSVTEQQKRIDEEEIRHKVSNLSNDYSQVVQVFILLSSYRHG